jgi:hypothetical protein
MERQELNDIIYSLNVEDIQNVSQQEIERKLSVTEIESIKELIASKINWYDAIAEAIHQSIKTEEVS